MASIFTSTAPTDKMVEHLGLRYRRNSPENTWSHEGTVITYDEITFTTAKPTTSLNGRTVYVRDLSTLYTQSGDGGTVATGGGANKTWYAQIQMSKPTRMGCEFSLVAGSVGRAGAVVIAPWMRSLETAGTPRTSLFISINRWKYSVGRYTTDSGGTYEELVGGYHKKTLVPGTKYKVEAYVHNGNAWLRLPFGKTIKLPTTTTALIGDYFAVQSYQLDGAIDDRAIVHSAWVDNAPSYNNYELIEFDPVLSSSVGRNTGDIITLPTPSETLVANLTLSLPAGTYSVQANYWLSVNSGGVITIFNYENPFDYSISHRNYVWTAPSGRTGLQVAVDVITVDSPRLVTVQLYAVTANAEMVIDATRPFALTALPA